MISSGPRTEQIPLFGLLVMPPGMQTMPTTFLGGRGMRCKEFWIHLAISLRIVLKKLQLGLSYSQLKR